MPLGTEVGLVPGHTVLDGDPATLPQKWAQSPPNFRPMSIVAKRLDDEDDLMMPFGTEAGLGPGDIVLARPCSFER